MKNIEEIKKLLKKYEYKVTPARVAILEVFSSGCNPVAAVEIHSKIKSNIDLVTIYRTLDSFEKSGILRRVSLQKSSAYFELNSEHHHHIICTNCQKVVEFVLNGDKKLIASILKQVKNFKSVSEHNFDLFGLCDSCLP